MLLYFSNCTDFEGYMYIHVYVPHHYLLIWFIKAWWSVTIYMACSFHVWTSKAFSQLQRSTWRCRLQNMPPICVNDNCKWVKFPSIWHGSSLLETAVRKTLTNVFYKKTFLYWVYWRTVWWKYNLTLTESWVDVEYKYKEIQYIFLFSNNNNNNNS